MELRLQGDAVMRTRAAVALLAVFLAASAVASTRAIVVDDHAFRVVNLVTGKTESIPLRAGHQRVLYSSDLTRIIVFSIPEENAAPAAATVIDASTLTPLASTDLGWGINDVLPVGDDHVYVLTRGVRSETASRRHGADLLKLSLRTGEVEQHVAFDRDADELDLLPDGKTAMVYMSGDARRGTPAEMRFVDRESFEQKPAVKMATGAGAPLAFRESDQFYSIDKAGKLYIFSSEPAALAASVDIGDNAEIAAVQPATGRIFVLSRTGENEGSVEVVRNGAVEKRVPLTFEPLFFRLSSDGRYALVQGRSFRGVMGIHAARETSLDFTDLPVVQDQPVMVETRAERAVNRVGRALERCCGTLDHSIVVADRIGRAAEILEGEKTANVLRAGTIIGAIAVSMFSDERIAAHISEPQLYSDYFNAPQATSVDRGTYFTSRDGEFQYRLDRQEHLIVTRSYDGKRVAKIGVDDGQQELVTLGGERALAVIGDDRLSLVDLQRNRLVVDTIKVGGDVREVAVSPDERYAAVIGEDRVTIVDGNDVAVRSTLRDLSGKIHVIFD